MDEGEQQPLVNEIDEGDNDVENEEDRQEETGGLRLRPPANPDSDASSGSDDGDEGDGLRLRRQPNLGFDGPDIRIEISERRVPAAEAEDRRARIELEFQIVRAPHPYSRNVPINYDMCLAGQHRYLGENMSQVSGCRVFEPGKRCRFPVLECKALLIPGRKLPLMCENERQKAMLNQLTSGSESMFAVVCKPEVLRQDRGRGLVGPDTEELVPQVGSVGCTAELMSYGTTEQGEMRAICKGVQRFRLISLRPTMYGVKEAEVEIMADDPPPAYPRHLLACRPRAFVRSPFRPPAFTRMTDRQARQDTAIACSTAAAAAHLVKAISSRSARPRSRHSTRERMAETVHTLAAASRSSGHAEEASAAAGAVAAGAGGADESQLSGTEPAVTSAVVADQAADGPGDHVPGAPSPCELLQVTNQSMRYAHCLMSPIPLRAFQQSSYELVVERTYSVFKDLLPKRDDTRMMSRYDVIPFSYHILSCMPLDYRTQHELLTLDSSLKRLCRVLDLMTRCTHYCCAKCGANVARRDKVISMSEDGPSALFVNPQNVMTEVFTVFRTLSASTMQIRPPSSEFSWFPGYQWCCCMCFTCHGHIGWLFEALDDERSPQAFYGLCQNRVVPDFAAPTHGEPTGHVNVLNGFPAV